MRLTSFLCFSALASFAMFTTAASARTILPKNTTDVTLTQTAVDDLNLLGISIGLTGSASLVTGSNPPEVKFPITGGDAEGPDLLINHDGSGLSLTKGSTTVYVGNFLVDTGNLDVLSYVNSTPDGSPTFWLFNIVPASPLELTLTSDAATALNTAFGTMAFTSGLEFATVTTNPVLAPEASSWVMLASGFAALGLLTAYRRRPSPSAA